MVVAVYNPPAPYVNSSESCPSWPITNQLLSVYYLIWNRVKNGCMVEPRMARWEGGWWWETMLRVWQGLVHGELKGRIPWKLVFTLKGRPFEHVVPLVRTSAVGKSSWVPPYSLHCHVSCQFPFQISMKHHLLQDGTSLNLFDILHLVLFKFWRKFWRCNFLQKAWLVPVIDLKVLWSELTWPNSRHLSHDTVIAF